MCENNFAENLASLDNKQRRNLISKEIDELGNNLPFDVSNSSQIKKLQAICLYIRKERHFEGLKALKQKNNSLLIQCCD